MLQPKNRLAEWTQNKIPINAVYKRPTSDLGILSESERTEKVFHAKRN